MKSFRVILSGISTAATLALLRVSASAAQNALSLGAQAAHGAGQPTDAFGEDGIFATLTDTMLFFIGAIAVVMLIYAGFRYVVSGGNAANVTAAKNTILYAIVGVAVALLSYSIIDFVLDSFDGSISGTNGL